MPRPRCTCDPYVPTRVGGLVERATIPVVALYLYASQRWSTRAVLMHVQRQCDVRDRFLHQVRMLGRRRGDALIPGVGLVAGLRCTEVPRPRCTCDPYVPTRVSGLIEVVPSPIVTLYLYSGKGWPASAPLMNVQGQGDIRWHLFCRGGTRLPTLIRLVAHPIKGRNCIAVTRRWSKPRVAIGSLTNFLKEGTIPVDLITSYAHLVC